MKPVYRYVVSGRVYKFGETSYPNGIKCDVGFKDTILRIPYFVGLDHHLYEPLYKLGVYSHMEVDIYITTHKKVGMLSEFWGTNPKIVYVEQTS